MTKAERQREAAIAALLECRTEREAASRCGLSLRSLKRLVADAAFQKEYSAARARLIQGATLRLRRDMAGAASILSRIARNRKAPAGPRVSAAKAVIELGLKAHEVEDLEQRLAVVEREVDTRNAR
jgi:hypothetical protein